ncbi:MAG: aminotransferase class V-fold PLP-dependent enzyme [FCB group bacterium]|nr:aminotransferase class V-fold PLP-dependent enzyme [FCB group bacterium]
MKSIYLDYNATTPIDPAVGDAMLPFIHKHFGNPSSGHEYGLATKKAIDQARQQVADMAGCLPEEIIFTSGGSEANNFAIKGTAHVLHHKGNHIITSAVEHPAVTEVCRYLENHGFEITYLTVDEFGLVDVRQVEEAITPQTILITIMHANNEVGTIEPIVEISELARRNNIQMHSDCAQSVGKIPVTVDKLGVDMLSIAGHKLYAPKGIGALYVRTGIELEKQMHGADHEMNRRAGTENVLEIVGLGKACEMVKQNLASYHDYMQKTRDRLEFALKEKLPSIKINGHPVMRLPNTASISFPGLEANKILAELSEVAASAGAACHSDQINVSSVLEAMLVPLDYAMGTVRFSTGRHTTIEEIDRAVQAILRVVEKM